MCSYNNKAKSHAHSNSDTHRVLVHTSIDYSYNYTSSKERAIELVENSYSIGVVFPKGKDSIGPAVRMCVNDG